MNGTSIESEEVIRNIVQNVTEHLQEDEKDSFLLAYCAIAVIICLIATTVLDQKFAWFPSVLVYLVIGVILQKFLIYSISKKYNDTVHDSTTQYSQILQLCFLPMQMFQYGFSLNGPLFLKNVKSISILSIGISVVFITLFTFLFSNLSVAMGLKPLSFWNLLAFGAAMSASDSAFVLPFLRNNGCSKKILAIMEGETIISEVISILVFRTIVEMQINIMNGILLIEGFNYFISFFLLSFGIGIGTGVFATVLFKWMYQPSKRVDVMQVTLFFSVPIMSYMLAEGLHVSSSISIRICGFIMSYFTQHNLNDETYPFFSIHSVVLTITRSFVQQSISFLGYISEMCCYMVLGMITYNVQPFFIDWRYAAVTGIAATVMKCVFPGIEMMNHKHFFVLYFVYRGSVAFTLTARGEGELLDNTQVLLMMRLSLCVIWVSVIQQTIIGCPLFGLSEFRKHYTTLDGDEDQEKDSRPSLSMKKSSSLMDMTKEWMYSLMVRTPKEDDEASLPLNPSSQK